MSEKHILSELTEWEKKLKGCDLHDDWNGERIHQWIESHFHKLDRKSNGSLVHVFDDILVYTYTILENLTMSKRNQQQILNYGRIFNTSLDSIEDMKYLTIDQRTYIASEQMKKAKLVAITQGGLTGIGNLMSIGVDVPVSFLHNLRAIQQIGLSFGYEMNKLNEMMYCLLVFQVASLPTSVRRKGWEMIKRDFKRGGIFLKEDFSSMPKDYWMRNQLQFIIKLILMFLDRQNRSCKWSPVRISVGAFMNYQLTSFITEFGLKCYQYRYLYDKGYIND
ncbi:EcsC family protein [Salirhabdus salicampi]|uniref:EcsC family protein n=1 Tax=Salirhabdus salicampi TaxID=476102 RepID=UPI0020C3F778|nr:EcsC family protein [Salirhabdus salicampi]